MRVRDETVAEGGVERGAWAVMAAVASTLMATQSVSAASFPDPMLPAPGAASSTAATAPPSPAGPSVSPPSAGAGGSLKTLICPSGGVRGGPAHAPTDVTPMEASLQEALANLTSRRLVTVLSEGGGACSALGELHGPTAGMADLALLVTSASGPEEPRARAWLGFQFRGELTVKVLGRVFTGDVTAHALALPPGLEVALATALAEALAYRVSDDSGKADRAPEAIRRRALDDLRAVDSDALGREAPRLAAVIKQLRGLLLLDGPCEMDSPVELFRAAARLAPESGDARTLIGLARLKEAYEPHACTALAEGELRDSLELDPWRDSAADNLGLLYELVANTRPPSTSEREISSVQATKRLDTIWKDAAPRPPRALELAVAASFSSALDQTAGALAPGLRAELGYGRDGSGWGARAGLSLLWTREVAFAPDEMSRQGRVRWTRFALDLGGRYRLVARPGMYAELGAGVLVAPVYASGTTFDTNYAAWGVNVGGTAAARVGQRLGPFSLWLGLAGSYFIGRDSRTLQADPPATAELPSLDLTALGGLSYFFWL